MTRFGEHLTEHLPNRGARSEPVVFDHTDARVTHSQIIHLDVNTGHPAPDTQTVTTQ